MTDLPLTSESERAQALARCSICKDAAIREQNLVLNLERLNSLQVGDRLEVEAGWRPGAEVWTVLAINGPCVKISIDADIKPYVIPKTILQAAIRGGAVILRAGLSNQGGEGE